MASETVRRQQIADRQRGQILRRFDHWFEMPMILLGFVWLILLVIELVRGLSSMLQTLGTVIWVLFILDFAFRFVLAPQRDGFSEKTG